MLRTEHTLTVYRHPGKPPDGDDSGENQSDIRENDFPIGADRSRYVQPLRTFGSEDSPDEFDVSDRIPLEFAGDSPQQEAKREKRIERDLAAAYEELTLITDDDTSTTEDGE